MQSVARPEHRFMDACRLRGGNAFSAPVKETRLQELGRESRMALMNCARDGVFPTPRQKVFRFGKPNRFLPNSGEVC